MNHVSYAERSYVTHGDQLFRTWKWVMSHTLKRVTTRTCKPAGQHRYMYLCDVYVYTYMYTYIYIHRIWSESCQTYEWMRLHHTWEWVVSHTQMSHVMKRGRIHIRNATCHKWNRCQRSCLSTPQPILQEHEVSHVIHTNVTHHAWRRVISHIKMIDNVVLQKIQLTTLQGRGVTPITQRVTQYECDTHVVQYECYASVMSYNMNATRNTWGWVMSHMGKNDDAQTPLQGRVQWLHHTRYISKLSF